MASYIQSMQTEIEAKFTDIKLDEMRERLRQLGAVCEYPERTMRRVNFNHINGPRAWVRVRDEGDKVTMSYKQTFEDTLHGTKEINLVVDNFENAVELLEAVGLSGRIIQVTKRELWRLNECDVTLDTWPWVPSFVEIEGLSEVAVRETAKLLGCEWERALFGGVESVYLQYYQLKDHEINDWPEITFVPVPEWLIGKRKS